MARYFFNIRTVDSFLADSVGVELPDLEAAKSEATESAKEILSEQVKHGEVIDGRNFEITDSSGTVCATIAFRGVLRWS